MERHPRVRCQVLGCRAWAKRGSHYCVAHEAMSQRQAARGEPNTPEMAREAPRPQCRVAGCRSLAASGSELCAVPRDQDVSPDHPAAVALYDLMARLNLHVDLGPSAVRLEMDMLQTVRRLFVAGMQDLGAGGHDVDRLLDTVYARLETEEPAASPASAPSSPSPCRPTPTMAPSTPPRPPLRPPPAAGRLVRRSRRRRGRLLRPTRRSPRRPRRLARPPARPCRRRRRPARCPHPRHPRRRHRRPRRIPRPPGPRSRPHRPPAPCVTVWPYRGRGR